MGERPDGTKPLTIKHYSLTGRITPQVMYDAFRSVRRNRGAAGVDRQSISMFEANLEQNLTALMRELKTGTFQPRPARRTYIDKGGGKKRPLGIPCVRDRVAQEVLRPLLANIALNFLDWQLHEAGLRFVRYADDFVVLCRSPHHAQEARNLVERVVTDLGLTLSPEKTHVAKFREGFAFLGFLITHRARRMRSKSVEKYRDRIRELTIRSHNLDARVVARINAVIRGVARYFATTFSTVTSQFMKLDAWTRTRLRSMKLKRISKLDKLKLQNKHLQRLGLISLSDFLTCSVN